MFRYLGSCKKNLHWLPSYISNVEIVKTVVLLTLKGQIAV